MKDRNLAIDIFRGLTMALMIFVNDLWTVHGVPEWMLHTETEADGMGLSDLVFPMFLFAMGMSIPYAIEKRLANGKSMAETITHVLQRAFALIVMGVFLNNSGRNAIMDKSLFCVLILLCIFLIWNKYPDSFRPARWFRIAGTAGLAILAISFRTGHGHMMRAGWWGILGLIGWAYLFAAGAYLLCRKKPWTLVLILLGLCFVNLTAVEMRSESHWLGKNILTDFADALNIENGAHGILALGGVLTVLAGKRLEALGSRIASCRLCIGLAAAAVLAGLGLLCHQGWIISKNIATLPWCLFAGAISVALYTILRALERHGWTAWAKPISPAGTATLTIYMIPYLFYALRHTLDIDTPDWLTGGLGLCKCLAFVAICLLITHLLTKINIKLKI